MVTRSSCTRSCRPARLSGPRRMPFAAWIQRLTGIKCISAFDRVCQRTGHSTRHHSLCRRPSTGNHNIGQTAQEDAPPVNPPIATGKHHPDRRTPTRGGGDDFSVVGHAIHRKGRTKPGGQWQGIFEHGQGHQNKILPCPRAESKSPRPSGRRAAPKTASTNTTAKVYPTEPQGLSDHHAIETRQHAEHIRRPSSSSWTGHAPGIEQTIQLFGLHQSAAERLFTNG